MNKLAFLSLALIAGLAAPAVCEPLVLYPVQTGTEQARYRLGVATLTTMSATGSVQVTPIGFDHGNVTLGIVVLNQSTSPANFGVENVAVSAQGQQLSLFTTTQLQQKAQNRANWAKVGNALVYSLAQANASQIHNTYASGVSIGNVSAVSVYKDYTPGAIAAGNVYAEGAVAEAAIQQRLDNTLDHLGEEIVQTTTVDPGSPYGGRVVVAGSGKLKAPYDLRIVVSWNGSQYPFTFRITKTGQNVPPPFTGTPANVTALIPSTPVGASAVSPASFQQANFAPPRTSLPVAAANLSPFEQGRLAAAAQLAASGLNDNQ